MRVLQLLRQSRGGMFVAASQLASALRERHVDVEVLDASSVIPNETGPLVDKPVSVEVRRICAEFDLVHAWGYRSAWACAEAFGDKEAWVYSAYDVPKTTHRLLIDHLNRSQFGFCSSRAVYRKLDEALALDLEIVPPGLGPVELDGNRSIARSFFGIEDNATVVGVLSRFVANRGVDGFLAALPKVVCDHPEARFLIAGEGPEQDRIEGFVRGLELEQNIALLPWQEDPYPFLQALDLLVVPSIQAGFSMAAIQAMAVGTPALLRDSGGLREIVDTDVSGFLYRDDEDLGQQLIELIGLPLTLESVGHGAKIRAMDHFSIGKHADKALEVYERIVEG